MLYIWTKACVVRSRLVKDKRGVTALEYGLIAAAIVATVTFGFASLADALSSKFVSVGTAL